MSPILDWPSSWPTPGLALSKSYARCRELEKRWKIGCLNKTAVRDRVLSDEEWSKVYQAAKLRPVLLTAYQLGQRFSEIVGLTWDSGRYKARLHRFAVS